MNSTYAQRRFNNLLIIAIVTAGLSCAYSTANAQFSSHLSVGINAGGTSFFSDFNDRPAGYAGGADLDYMITPFLSAGVNASAGQLKGKSDFAAAKNNFIAVNANMKIRAGQFYAARKNYGLYSLKNKGFVRYLSYIYAGTGIGLIRSDLKNEQTGSTAIDRDSKYGEYDKTALVIPVDLGIDIPFKQTMTGPVWSININYQLNFSGSDRIDGFTPNFSEHKDIYSYWSVGLRKAL